MAGRAISPWRGPQAPGGDASSRLQHLQPRGAVLQPGTAPPPHTQWGEPGVGPGPSVPPRVLVLLVVTRFSRESPTETVRAQTHPCWLESPTWEPSRGRIPNTAEGLRGHNHPGCFCGLEVCVCVCRGEVSGEGCSLPWQISMGPGPQNSPQNGRESLSGCWCLLNRGGGQANHHCGETLTPGFWFGAGFREDWVACCSLSQPHTWLVESMGSVEWARCEQGPPALSGLGLIGKQAPLPVSAAVTLGTRFLLNPQPSRKAGARSCHSWATDENTESQRGLGSSPKENRMQALVLIWMP